MIVALFDFRLRKVNTFFSFQFFSFLYFFFWINHDWLTHSLTSLVHSIEVVVIIILIFIMHRLFKNSVMQRFHELRILIDEV